jgi:hypothetical protein
VRERRYASSADYANHTGDRAPEDLDRRVLVRASQRVDAALIGAVYDVDEAGMPTDPETLAALRDATCAQVHYWQQQGDKTGTGTATQWGSVKIGDVQLGNPTTAAGGGGSAGTLCAEADDVLRVAGLLPVSPWLFG